MKDHNRCSACGVDFSLLRSFDQHRKGFRITRRQELVGSCTAPQELGLVEYSGTWFTPEGRERVDRLAEARKERGKKGTASSSSQEATASGD